MSIKDTLKSLKDIKTWDKAPWDKVAHTLLFFAFGIPVALLAHDPNVGSIAGAFMLYGREEAQAEHYAGEVGAWFPWNWHMDGILDLAIPVAIGAPLMYYGFNYFWG